MQRSTFAISGKTLRILKAIPILGLILALALAMVVVMDTALPTPAFAAIAQRGTATTASVLNNASLVVNKPAGVVAGDLMIANLVQVNSLTPPTAPAGWTLIDQRSLAGMTNRYASVFYKVAGGSEGANYTFTVPTGATVRATGGIVAFSGVDSVTPFDVTPGTIRVNPSGNCTANGITTVSANTVIVMLGQAANSGPAWSAWTTATSPGALTEILDYQAGATTSIGAAWALKAAAGATGNGTATLSGGGQRNGGILLAIRPGVTTVGDGTAPSNKTVLFPPSLSLPHSLIQ